MNESDPLRPLAAELEARVAAGSEELQDYLDLASLAESSGQEDLAIRTYERAMSLRLAKLQLATVLTRLSAALDMSGRDRVRAVALAHQAFDLVADEPETVDTLLLRGLNLSRIASVTWFDDQPQAENLGQQALEALEYVIRYGRDAESITAACFGAAWIRSALGDQQRAIMLYEQCLAGPLDAGARAEALTMLAEALRLEGRLVDAEQAARSAVRLVEEGAARLPRAHVTLGLIQRGRGQFTEAREVFAHALRHAVEAIPRHDAELLRTIYGNLAELDYQAREDPRASGTLHRLLALYPDDGVDRHRVLIWLGDCYAGMSCPDEARAYYEEVIRSPIAADEERHRARKGLRTLSQ